MNREASNEEVDFRNLEIEAYQLMIDKKQKELDDICRPSNGDISYLKQKKDILTNKLSQLHPEFDKEKGDFIRLEIESFEMMLDKKLQKLNGMTTKHNSQITFLKQKQESIRNSSPISGYIEPKNVQENITKPYEEVIQNNESNEERFFNPPYSNESEVDSIVGSHVSTENYNTNDNVSNLGSENYYNSFEQTQNINLNNIDEIKLPNENSTYLSQDYTSTNENISLNNVEDIAEFDLNFDLNNEFNSLHQTSESNESMHTQRFEDLNEFPSFQDRG
ncbi:MAG: hypothetical protein R3Y64_07040 [Peptostreptococcaceae bacterium]